MAGWFVNPGMKPNIITAVSVFLANLAAPARTEDLRFALSSSPTAMDPRFHNLGANLSVTRNVFDERVENFIAAAGFWA
jgi:hypothetical protein